MGDALSHAALPGLCLAFIITGSKNYFSLLFGALVSGVLGVLAIVFLVRHKRVNEDAAIGIVLSSFFGVGICLGSFIQNRAISEQAGLDRYIYGHAASMLRSDALAIAAVCALVLIFIFLFFKELRLICFDPDFARSTAWPVTAIDLLLMSAIVACTIVGLQAVGVVLIIALLIIPAAAARFWTDSLGVTVVLAAIVGALSSASGSAFSALVPKLPTGPLIVLIASCIFVASFVFRAQKGPARSLPSAPAPAAKSWLSALAQSGL